MYFQVQKLGLSLFWSVSSDIDSMNWLKKSNGLFIQYFSIEVLFLMLGFFKVSEQLIDSQPEFIQVVRVVCQASRERNVEIRNKIFDMYKKRVSLCIDCIDLDDWP
jgi:hypothetical protein